MSSYGWHLMYIKFSLPHVQNQEWSDLSKLTQEGLWKPEWNFSNERGEIPTTREAKSGRVV